MNRGLKEVKERTMLVGVWDKSIPDRGHSRCKVSEAGPRTQKPMWMEKKG